MKDFLKENLHLIYNIQTKQQMQDYKIMSCDTRIKERLIKPFGNSTGINRLNIK